MPDQPTYWNGEPCEARRVRVVVADDVTKQHYWAHPFIGTERAAVEVKQDGEIFYIDDEGFDELPFVKDYMRARGRPVDDHIGFPGWGWAKVASGGGPALGHASLQVEHVVMFVDCCYPGPDAEPPCAPECPRYV